MTRTTVLNRHTDVYTMHDIKGKKARQEEKLKYVRLTYRITTRLNKARLITYVPEVWS